MITASELEHELADLARLARKLMPALAHRPHLFHEQKDALVRAIEELLDRARGAPAPEHAFRARQIVDCGRSICDQRGRVIAVVRRAR